jgi:hypothetical protein
MRSFAVVASMCIHPPDHDFLRDDLAARQLRTHDSHMFALRQMRLIDGLMVVLELGFGG